MTDTAPPAAMTSLLRRGQDYPSLQPAQKVVAVLTRADEALRRIDQLSAALEKAADDIERQLAAVKGRL